MSFSKDELEKLKPLFWEYKWESVKENLTSPVVIARVLEMANPEQFKIFSSAVGDEEIMKFLKLKEKRCFQRGPLTSGNFIMRERGLRRCKNARGRDKVVSIKLAI